jgi:hypothetical protein
MRRAQKKNEKKKKKQKKEEKKTKEEKIKKSDENPQKTPFGTAAGHCGVPQVKGKRNMHLPSYSATSMTGCARQMGHGN